MSTPDVALRTFAMQVFHNERAPINQVEKDLRDRFEIFISEYLSKRLDAPIDVRVLSRRQYREYEADPQAFRRKFNTIGGVSADRPPYKLCQFTVAGAPDRIIKTAKGEVTLSVKDPDTGEVSELFSFDNH